MAAARIGDRELRPESTKETRTASHLARASAAIASPVAVLTLLPLLVASIGLFLTVIGQRSLRDSNLTMAADRIDEETALLARSISAALEQSDPVMDRLSSLAQEHDPIKSFDRVAHSLRDLMQGRPGVSYVSISFPDGTFQGAYRDEDGTIRFQDSRVTAQGTIVKRYTLIGHERITPYYEERSNYDPRGRDFYNLAASSGQRVWTKPYPFFKTHYTGITRAEAVREPGTSTLHAVITVDFDVTALSAVLSRTAMGGAATLLYTQDGSVLAYPSGEGRINDLPLRQDRALLYSDLDDPLLNAFFEEFGGPDSAPATGLAKLDVSGEKQLVAKKPIVAGHDLGWSVATIMPEARILSALHLHQQKSTVAAAIATLLASAMAWLFARHIVRTRREAAVARAEAREAVARAQELGSYRLVEMLGKGGMGEVWRAEHRLLVRQAAIKLISMSDDAGLDTSEIQERFRREAQSLATLRSRNTIELFDYGVTAEGTCFYVMELLDGMDLETLVDKYGPQPASRVIDFLLQACNSLAEAHDAGLVHRDIKPANLYVCRVADEVDVVKVLDFGLVRAAVSQASLRPPASPGAPAASEELEPSHHAESGVHPGARRSSDDEQAASASVSATGAGEERLTQVGQAMGTPAYMAPEQALGYELDGRADLYALGCIGFFLLSGRLVFERSGSLPMMMAHITDAPPDFKDHIPNYLPAELAAVLLHCLAKKPNARPHDARALAAALKAIHIPPAQEWSEARAQAWWAARKPKPSPPANPVDANSATQLVQRGVA
ncbi:MAG TPA: serine/threonine protein kinase [Polyangiaceae bacterium]|nr:serine/threonine protein kinase [Polyangiaceae bacterium]